MRCTSGRHEWIGPDDAAKCCNGWERVTEIPGSYDTCDTLSVEPSSGVLIGRRWERERSAQ